VFTQKAAVIFSCMSGKSHPFFSKDYDSYPFPLKTGFVPLQAHEDTIVNKLVILTGRELIAEKQPGTGPIPTPM